MKNKLLRLLVCVLGVLLGLGFVSLVFNFMPDTVALGVRVLVTLAVLALSFFIFFLTSGFIVRALAGTAQKVDRLLSRVQMGDLFFACLGAALGIWIASMLSELLRQLPYGLFLALSALLYVALAFLFGSTARKRWRELPFISDGKKIDRSLAQFRESVRGGEDSSAQDAVSPYKLLDTSALVDGRILPLCKIGFVEGTLIVPQFVLDEVQLLADSADETRHQKGRRALATLESLKEAEQKRLQCGRYEDTLGADCDAKLMQLALRLGGTVITTDYNLQKAASMAGITVLNLHELSMAMGTLPIQGDRFTVQITKPGREEGQGVGYLADGTMIVVQGASGSIGQTVQVEVTGALRTASGQMIFAKMD